MLLNYQSVRKGYWSSDLKRCKNKFCWPTRILSPLDLNYSWSQRKCFYQVLWCPERGKGSVWLGLQLVLAIEELLWNSVLLATRRCPVGVQFPLLLHLALAVSCPTSHTGSTNRGRHRAPPQSSPEDTPQMSSTGDSGKQIDDFLVGTGNT